MPIVTETRNASPASCKFQTLFQIPAQAGSLFQKESDMTIVEQDYANSSIGIPNAELYLMAHNNNGTADSFSNSLYTYNCLFTGGGAVDLTQINALVFDYLKCVGYQDSTGAIF